MVCWTLTRTPAGKRLAPMLATVVPLLRRDGEIVLNDAEAALLVSMSPASIDRHLAPERAACATGTLPHEAGHAAQVPDPHTDLGRVDRGHARVRGDRPGRPRGRATRVGEFCFTLTVTDIATGWTINRSVKNKAAIWVFEALSYVIGQFPFPILGIDSDNGSEFINAHLLAYCDEHEITFTRSRPGNKNDGAHVEQKNWTHVRELVGYLRFDTEEELDDPERDLGARPELHELPPGPAEAHLQATQGGQGHEEARHRSDAVPTGERPIGRLRRRDRR